MGESGGHDAWALEHFPETVATLRFVGRKHRLQAPLLSVLWDTVVQPSRGARMCAALLAGALAPCLSSQQVRPPPCSHREHLTASATACQQSCGVQPQAHHRHLGLISLPCFPRVLLKFNPDRLHIGVVKLQNLAH